jgi:hypothetical protein
MTGVDLAAYQDAFARALLVPPGADAGPARQVGASTVAAARASGPAAAAASSHAERADVDAAALVAALAAQPGFAVHRNTVLKGAIDAIEANYPAVTRLVGGEWMRAAAAAYVREEPPAEPSLLQYGAGFPAWLSTFPPAADLRWLADVARLDRAWTEAHVAADEPPVEAAAVAALAPAELARTLLRPHASARWHFAAGAPIHTLWQRNRRSAAELPDADVGADLEWRGEGALLTRPKDAVESIALDAAGIAFLDACAAGGTLADAAAAALAAGGDTEAGADTDRAGIGSGPVPGVDLAQLMAALLTAGAFGEFRLLAEPSGSAG